METEETTEASESELPDQQPPINVNSEQEEESSSIGKQSEKTVPVTQGKEIFKAIEVVERDSLEIAQSYTSLFASLRLALSQVTSTSVDHMSCFSDAAGRLQECALDAATKGNHYINSCLRLNEEMKGIENLASQLKILRRNVDALDSAVNKMVRLP